MFSLFCEPLLCFDHTLRYIVGSKISSKMHEMPLKICMCSQKLALQTGWTESRRCPKVHHISAYYFLGVLSIALYKNQFFFLRKKKYLETFTHLSLTGCVWTVEITCQISWLLVCLLMSKWFLESVGDPLLLNSWCLVIYKYTVVT